MRLLFAHKQWRTPTFALLALIGALQFGLWGNIALEHRQDREQTLHEADVQASNLARAFDEHVARTVQHLDTILLHLRQQFLADPQSFGDRRGDALWNTYRRAFMQVAVIDRDGWLVYSNLAKAMPPVDLSDREHFRVHRDGTEDTLFISTPVFGRVSRQWSIQFTRRMSAPDGRFAGVMVISVDPSYFSEFYRSINIGARGAVTLLGTDGIIRAWASRAESGGRIIGSALPEGQPFLDPTQPDAGVYRTASAVDGTVRIGAYRRLREFPLIVLVTLAEDEILAEAEGRLSSTALAGGVVSALLFGSGHGILWLLARERRSREALERANAELRYLAETDVLTGAKNRRAATGLAEAEIARHQRYARPLSLVMMDLDHFKRINDRYGHAAGDAVLVEVIQRTRASLRRHDVIGRMGGEEFILLLPETDLAQAQEVAERVRRRIAESSVVTPVGEALQVTVSMGISTLDPGDDLDHLLCRADDALYQAKAQGRDRSLVAGGVGAVAAS